MLPIALLATAWAEPLPPGRYALEVDIATETRVPVHGRVRVRTRSQLIADVHRDGDALIQTQRVCDVRVDDDSGLAKTVIPDRFVAALEPRSGRIELTETPDGWRYRLDTGPVHIGYDPALGPLPDRRKEASVVDFEGDGWPGATVWLEVPVIGVVRLYVAQHGHSVLDGTVTDGRVDGGIDMIVLEQVTLAASHPFFAGEPPVTWLEAPSRFRMVPAPPEADCDDAPALLAAAR